MDFYISTSSKKINFKDTLKYHWFKSQKLHITQGGAAGHLLHGHFQKFHNSGQLAECGEFKFGLKDGEWLTWYESGGLKSKLYYHEGVLKGSYTLYTENGQLRESGRYRKGQKKLKKIRKNKSSQEPNPNNEDNNEGEEENTPWYKNLFKIERKENPEREAKRLARRTRRQEKKMAKEREEKND
jgi:antitoxin component YwqK of YwqJK toxin-antitoxin module